MTVDGYKNYPTCAVALYLRNDRGIAQSLEAQLERFAENVWYEGGRGIKQIEAEAKHRLAAQVQHDFELGAEDLDSPFDSWSAWAIEHVDWDEAVDSVFIDDLAELVVRYIVELLQEE